MLLKFHSFFSKAKVYDTLKNKRFRFFSSKDSRKMIFKHLNLNKNLITKNFVFKYYFKPFTNNLSLVNYKNQNKISLINPNNKNVCIRRLSNKFLVKKNGIISFFGFNYKKINLNNMKNNVNVSFSSHYLSSIIINSGNSTDKKSKLSIKNRLFPFKKYFMPTKKILFQQTQVIITSFLYFRLVNIFIKSGLKLKIENNIQKILFQLKDFFCESEFKMLYSHNFIFLTFILFVPKLTVKGVRRGSVVYKVPFLITPFQQFSIFLKWFKDSVYLRNEISYKVRLFKEIFDLLDENSLSDTLKKRSSLNKAVINGRSFSHYRWV